MSADLKSNIIFSPATILSSLALSLSLAGLVDQYLILAQFDIGLADYADIDDFLVAAISFLDRPFRAIFMFAYGVIFPVLCVYTLSRITNKQLEKPEQSDPLGIGSLNESANARNRASHHKLLVKERSGILRIGFWFGVSTVPFIAWMTAPDIDKGEIEKSFCEVSVELKLPGPHFRYSDSLTLDPSLEESKSKIWLISGINASMFFVERTKDNDYISHALPTAAIAQVRYLSCPNEQLTAKEQLGFW